MNGRMLISLLKQFTVTFSRVGVDIVVQSLKVGGSKGIGHIMRNRHKRNIGSSESILIDEHLFDGRLSTPILDMTKLVREGGGGGRGVPQMSVETLTKRVKTVNRSLRIKSNINQGRTFLEQREHSAPVP